MASGCDGRLIVCEQGSRWQPARISRLDRGTGEREPVVEEWRGLRFKSPNALAAKGA
jgi:gluconolactonase